MRSRIACLATGILLLPPILSAQNNTAGLPDAPGLVAQTQPPAAPSQPAPTAQNVTSTTAPPVPAGPTLTRQQAEQLALKNNPRVSVAGLLALAQKQVVRETRSAEYPTLNGELTGVGAEEGSRLSTGSLNASRLLNHAGAGVEVTQLITDFGRTRNLVASSSFQAKASGQQAQATREDIVLATDFAFYQALEAQATL
jgi:outer membrane protein